MRPSLWYAKRLCDGRTDVVGVEVGVCEGYNALGILTNWEMEMLHLVEIDSNMSRLIEHMLDPISRSYELHIGDSVDVSAEFADESLDFVYLDDDHEYEGITRSLNAWYPKVKPGGVICGHDFDTCGAVGDVVRGFFDAHGLRLFTEDVDWWGVKPSAKQ